MRWRWQVASNDPDNPLPFQDGAIEKIYRITKGLPRDICSLCHRSLDYACTDGKRVVDADLVVVAANSLKFVEDDDQRS